MRRLDQLTGWRFVAAFGVVICHVSGRLILEKNHPLNIVFEGASNFVDFFFILSGFILAHTYRDRNVSYREFLQARFARIYPVALFSLIIALPRFLILNQAAILDGNGGVALNALGSILLIKTWLFPVNWLETGLLWNGPMWSIETEVFFYLLFPIIAQAVKKLSTRYRLLIAPVALTTLIVISFLFATLSLERSEPWLYSLLVFSPYIRILSFILGIGLYEVFVNGSESTQRIIDRASTGLFVVSLFAYVAINLWLPYLPKVYGLPSLIFCLWILLAANSSRATKILQSQTFVHLGEISFAIYLLHIPVLNIWGWLTKALSIRVGHQHALDLMAVAAGLVTTFFLANWAYSNIEVPWRARLRRTPESK